MKINREYRRALENTIYGKCRALSMATRKFGYSVAEMISALTRYNNSKGGK